MPVGFAEFLHAANLASNRTRLVRHQARSGSGRAPYDLWVSRNGDFEAYQSYQERPVFGDCQYVAALVATPLNETLFVGMYENHGSGIAPDDAIDPLNGRSVAGLVQYDLRPIEELREYSGRLIIDWGPGFRSWVQYADRRPKPILELRRSNYEQPFPGFSDFLWTIKRLPEIPTTWRSALASVQGVYVLISVSTGQRYVGSAFGDGGFWSRWESYYRNGHGGNEGMKLNPNDDYQVAILEVSSSSMHKADIERLEALWKQKLMTRKFGLNRN